MPDLIDLSAGYGMTVECQQAEAPVLLDGLQGPIARPALLGHELGHQEFERVRGDALPSGVHARMIAAWPGSVQMPGYQSSTAPELALEAFLANLASTPRV